MRRASSSLSLRQYGPSPGSHTHEHFQVLLGVEGELELKYKAGADALPPGTVA